VGLGPDGEGNYIRWHLKKSSKAVRTKKNTGKRIKIGLVHWSVPKPVGGTMGKTAGERTPRGGHLRVLNKRAPALTDNSIDTREVKIKEGPKSATEKV